MIAGCEINGYRSASAFLAQRFGNEVKQLNLELRDLWARKEWTDMSEMEVDVNCLVVDSFKNFQNESCVDRDLFVALECYILYAMHDNIMRHLYRHFRQEDDMLFGKFKELNDGKISAEQLGAFTAIPLPASIVELSSLDSHRTVLEKIKCLSNCFDLIFAELKMAMVETMVESSSKDHEIPVVNNEDVVPILMNVIVRSKLRHFYSNLYYVQSFTKVLMENKEVQ